MAKCEVDTNATYVQKGPYGQISLIEGTVKCLAIQPVEPIIKQIAITTERFPSRLFHRGRRDVPLASLQREIATINHHALVHHQLGNDDIEWLSSHRESVLPLAIWFNGFIGMYWSRYLEMITSDPFKKEKPPYTLGRSLADMLRLLPPPLSARVVEAAADSATSRDILAMTRFETFQNYDGNQKYDNQSYVIEGFALTPGDARVNIVGEMVQSPTGRIGARKLLHLINSHLADLLSPYSGIAAINRNLSGEETLAKIAEFRSSLVTLGQIVGFD